MVLMSNLDLQITVSHKMEVWLSRAQTLLRLLAESWADGRQRVGRSVQVGDSPSAM